MCLIRERFEEICVMIIPQLVPVPSIQYIVEAIHQEVLTEIYPHEKYQRHIHKAGKLQPCSQDYKEPHEYSNCLE
jgi:hypothetical protein